MLWSQRSRIWNWRQTRTYVAEYNSSLPNSKFAHHFSNLLWWCHPAALPKYEKSSFRENSQSSKCAILSHAVANISKPGIWWIAADLEFGTQKYPSGPSHLLTQNCLCSFLEKSKVVDILRPVFAWKSTDRSLGTWFATFGKFEAICHSLSGSIAIL